MITKGRENDGGEYRSHRQFSPPYFLPIQMGPWGVKAMNPETSVEKVDVMMNLPSTCLEAMNLDEASVEKEDGMTNSPCKISSLEKNETLKAKDTEALKTAEGGLGPVTPVPDRRNGLTDIGSVTPLTWVSSPLKAVTCNSDEAETLVPDATVQTPKGCVFDPFAPGPEELMFAPRKKILEEARTRPVRRLDFYISDVSMEEVGENEVDVVHEESLLESVYESLLDVIVSNQAEGIFAENPPSNLACDGFKTPVSSPPLKGVAEVCPGAPMKRARESRKYDPSICRRLEF